MSNASVDRNLLFGLLALQNGMITREALVAAFSVWLLDKNQTLEQILVEQQAIDPVRRAQLQQMLDWHVQLPGADAAQSLATDSPGRSARGLLLSLPGREQQASPRQVGPQISAADPFATQLGPQGAVNPATLRYRPVRPHAKGGLGEVSVALDSELNREVALKEIQARFADHQESRERFVLEAEITGGLEHPGIVPVYGMGTYGDGRPFYAMRFIKGDSLKDALEQFHNPQTKANTRPGEREFQLRKLLARFVAVCNAIDYAHSRGVLHRDIKPGNIMLGKYGETLVVDWGLAKSMGSAEVPSGEVTYLPASPLSSSGMTQPGSAIGTPAYMSAEQAAGRLDDVKPASDIYSLGATLYHVLTGRPPFEGNDVGTVLQRVQKGDFPHPRQIDPAIPRGLEAICLKAMSLKSENRYSSARSLADDVEHWLADEPITAVSDTTSDRVNRFARKHRGFFYTALVSLLVLTLGSTVAVFWIDGERREIHELANGQERIKIASIMSLYLRDVSPLAVFSPKGDYVLAGGDGDVLQLWDTSKLRVAFRLQGHEGTIRAAAFSRDGEYIVTRADDQSLKVWRVDDGKVVRSIAVAPLIAAEQAAAVAELPGARLPGNKSVIKVSQVERRGLGAGTPLHSVASVAFSPDGQKIASGDGQFSIRVWDFSTGNIRRTLRGHTGLVTSVAFDKQGQRLVSGSVDKTLRIWDLRTGRELISVPGNNVVSWVTFNNDGDQVHRFDKDGSLTTCNATTGKIISNQNAISNPFDIDYNVASTDQSTFDGHPEQEH